MKILLVKSSLHLRPQTAEVIKKLLFLCPPSSLCMSWADISVKSLPGWGTTRRSPEVSGGQEASGSPPGTWPGLLHPAEAGRHFLGVHPRMATWSGQGVPASGTSPPLGRVLPATCSVLGPFLRRWLHAVSRYCDFPCSKSELSYLGAGTKGNYLVSTSAYNTFIKFLHFKSG